jgi:hypothetical protein
MPNDVFNMFDFRSFGIETDYTEQRSSLPIKKEKGCELTTEEKEYDKNHFKKRIVIECAICRLKKYRIMNNIFRNRLRKYDRASDTVAGMVNYRIMNPVYNHRIIMVSRRY